MELIVLGSGTSVPSLKRASPALALKVASQSLLFDASSGTMHQLLMANIELKDLDHIFISHFHPDHTADLLPILFAMRSPFVNRQKPLSIFGPPGFERYYQQLQALYGHWVEAAGYSLIVRDLNQEAVSFDGFTVLPCHVNHAPESLGYRVETPEGKAFAYSGDTGYSEGVVRLGKEADLLVLECSLPEELAVKEHLTPSLAGKIAQEAKCKKLLLTHFYPICEEYDILGRCARAFTTGQILIAEDLMRIKI